MQYTPEWYISNLLLIPRMFFTETIIEKRKPLSPTARRAGWVGCNILPAGIPDDGKMGIVSAGVAEPQKKVREEFNRVRGLANLPPELRGWTVDVLNAIRRLRKPEFSLHEIYQSEGQLQVAHPRNQNIRPKIRQQLQVLRDLGLLQFHGRGVYSLR
jgi:type II restriction enzyme